VHAPGGADALPPPFHLRHRVRTSGIGVASELAPSDHRLLEFVWELGELAARGEDIRQRVHGTPEAPHAIV
jgi:hypothetical protein